MPLHKVRLTGTARTRPRPASELALHPDSQSPRTVTQCFEFHPACGHARMTYRQAAHVQLAHWHAPLHAVVLLQRCGSAGVEVHQVGRVSLRVVVCAVDFPAAAGSEGVTRLAAMVAAVRTLCRPPQMVVPCTHMQADRAVASPRRCAKAAIKLLSAFVGPDCVQWEG